MPPSHIFELGKNIGSGGFVSLLFVSLLWSVEGKSRPDQLDLRMVFSVQEVADIGVQLVRCFFLLVTIVIVFLTEVCHKAVCGYPQSRHCSPLH
jgi:hypothetical protein